MPESLLTKRLHISGLTPSITPTDLERRLSAFGTVKAMDGFGVRDALGDPRKFAYVTMEIGPKELAKCLNVLSGSTWKGTKLRIGEAKPDFRERIAQLNSMPPRSPRPKRERIRNHGLPSPKLPLTPLSPTAAASMPGWVVTPSGRIVRPMRMRPGRPLEHIRAAVGAATGRDGSKVKSGKIKKRIKPPPVRARRRTIDPTKWDSVYLKGVFLESVSVLPPPASTSKNGGAGLEGTEGSADEETSDGADDSGYESSSEEESTPVQPPQHPSISAPLVPSPPLKRPQQAGTEDVSALSAPTHDSADAIDLRRETAAALTLLGDMFADEEDWGGSESVDGMEDRSAEEEDTGKRLVDRSPTKQSVVDANDRTRDADVEMADANVPVEKSNTPTSNPPPPPTQAKLKDLFAPREEGASFSLLGHLDLDLELEDDILGVGASIAGAASHVHDSIIEPTIQTAIPQTRTHHSASCYMFPAPTLPSHKHNFLPPSSAFSRSPDETSDSIRAQWENEKGALTREWKKAWREARGSKRGRGGGGGGGDE
ncbi:hypothetical protein F5I97DRAFT_1809323 [Phlebopus sp. FC_14]|nr:hypothetical protein F5I97DRAFT_1809323 [Phlebopus sp. FC_14]